MRAPGLSRLVEDYARKSCRAFPLEELYRLGRGRSERLHLAQLIHQEIAIRNAQLCKELLLLPFGLAETSGVQKVVQCFSSYVKWLSDFPVPKDEDMSAFTELLKEILQDNADVTRTMSGANMEVRSSMGPQYEEIRSEVDFIFDRFFIKRIGLRFLIQHHIEAAEAAEATLLPGASGIIRSVSVGEILRAAAQEARSTVQEDLGFSPQVEVIGDGAEIPLVHANTFATGTSWRLNPNFNEFTHVPSHVHFICYQLLRNACQATAKRWQGQRLQKQRELLMSVATDAKPQSVPMGKATVAGFPFAARSGVAKSPEGLAPVRAIFAHGSEEVSIKVSDEGGGIPRSELPQVWSYSGTAVDCTSESPERLGVGLPLSRLHARYYGGDVVLKSMEGFGTDVYVFLNRLGHSCENLPQGVRLSPAQLDSSINKEASIRAELGDMSEAEVAHLTRRLQERRAKAQTQAEIE